jgi:hypothetical protein
VINLARNREFESTSLQRRVTNEPGSPILRPTENGSSGGQLPGFQPSTAVGEELLGGLDLAVERRRVVAVELGDRVSDQNSVSKGSSRRRLSGLRNL